MKRKTIKQGEKLFTVSLHVHKKQPRIIYVAAVSLPELVIDGDEIFIKVLGHNTYRKVTDVYVASVLSAAPDKLPSFETTLEMFRFLEVKHCGRSLYAAFKDEVSARYIDRVLTSWACTLKPADEAAREFYDRALKIDKFPTYKELLSRRNQYV